VTQIMHTSIRLSAFIVKDSRDYKEIMRMRKPFGPLCLHHTNTRFTKSVNTPSLHVQSFWLQHWYSFRRPQKDDSLSQPRGVNLAANGALTQDPRIQSHHPNHNSSHPPPPQLIFLFQDLFRISVSSPDSVSTGGQRFEPPPSHPKNIKMVHTAFLMDTQHLKG